MTLSVEGETMAKAKKWDAEFRKRLDKHYDEMKWLYHELYDNDEQALDYFIDMLDTVYEHYDALGKRTSDSSDGKFTVTPIGRMIVVKKKAGASSMTYDEVENALNIHYKNHRKVNSVYKNNGGTITIDCRK